MNSLSPRLQLALEDELREAYLKGIETGRKLERERIMKWVEHNSKELSDPYPFDNSYTYCNFVPVDDLTDFVLAPSIRSTLTPDDTLSTK
jgi:hypothetical protein